MVPLFANNAVGTLAAAYSAAATAITLTAGQGLLFPSPGAGQFFAITIVDPTNQIEIVYCTARTADTFTVQRGQEGTTPRALGAGEKVEHRLTAGTLSALRDRPLDADQIPDGVITSGKLAPNSVTSVKIADGAVGTAKLADGSVTAAKLAAGAAVANIGFTPVEQGGGVGMTPNKVRLGFSEPKLRAQIDVSDYGFILAERNAGDPSEAGYRGLPAVLHNENYVIGLSDAGKALLHTAGNHTYTLPSQSSVNFLGGAILKINNLVGVVTITPAAGVVLVWLPGGGAGARTLTGPGQAVLEQIAGDTWFVYGAGLS